MTEKYILVSDEEYVYTLDTSDENYKTLEDFEKQEFENAKRDGIDIKEYEDAILLSANDKYWDWVYDNHLDADIVNDIMNVLVDENEHLKKDNKEYIRGLDLSKATSQSWASDVRELRKWNCQLEKENDELKSTLAYRSNQLALLEQLIDDLGNDEMQRQMEMILNE